MYTDNKKVNSKRFAHFLKRNLRRFLSFYFYKNCVDWHHLKGRFKGERVFLIGNGPSLNKTPLYLLKNEYTLTFNRFGLLLERLNWKPNFFMTVDAIVAENIQDDLSTMIDLCDFAFFPDIHKVDNLNFRTFIPKKENVLFMHQEPVPGKFSSWLPFVGTGGSVIFEGFQVLKYLGFSEIYFLGVDMNYVIHKNTSIIKGNNIESKADDDPNHFDPRYFGKGKKYHQPTKNVVDNIMNSLHLISKRLAPDKCRAINVGYDSKVDYFPRKEFIESLQYSNEEIDKLFTDLIKKHGYESIEQINQQATVIHAINEFNDLENLMVVPTEVAVQIIKDKIYSFIPLGPYKGHIYFIKRT